MTSLSVRLNELRKEGYLIDLCIHDEAICNERTGEKFSIEQISIDKHFRFEGVSNPSDNAILYAVHINDTKKGVLIDAYGVDSSITKELYQLIR